jgi:hypothetical protein
MSETDQRNQQRDQDQQTEPTKGQSMKTLSISTIALMLALGTTSVTATCDEFQCNTNKPSNITNKSSSSAAAIGVGVGVGHASAIAKGGNGGKGGTANSTNRSTATSYGSSITYTQEDRGLKDVPNWAYVPGAATAYAAQSNAIGQKTWGVQIPWVGISGSSNDDLTRAMSVSAYARSIGNTALAQSAEKVLQTEMDNINTKNRKSTERTTNSGAFGY